MTRPAGHGPTRRSRILGTIVIENIGGAGSSLGTAAVARAKPDGYTILLGGNSGLVINPIASTRSPYDPVKDFEPIAILGRNATSIDVHPAQPIRSLKELDRLRQANPGKLSYGSSGVGTPNHLIGELFKSLTGTDIAHVPYRGAGPAMTDLISGHIPMMVQSVTGQAIEMHNAGKLRMLAVTSDEAARQRAGHADGRGGRDARARRDADFIGLFAPRGTPQGDHRADCAGDAQAMADKELQRMFITAGFEPELDSSPRRRAEALEAEIANWTPVIRSIGLKLD